MTPEYDAVVVGAGPNGLAAAITLAEAERSVLLLEAAESAGGGLQSTELTLPGFVHDVCSAIHPLGFDSPLFRRLNLAKYGLEWIEPPVAVAHPLDDGTAVCLERSVSATADGLGRDARRYRGWMEPLVHSWPRLRGQILGPLPWPPRHLRELGRFGRWALRSARGAGERLFESERARALFAGLAAHSVLPLERCPSAAIGVVLGILGHVVGWPFPRAGAQRMAEALADHLRSLGGVIETGHRVSTLDELPRATVTLLNLMPGQLAMIAASRLPQRYAERLRRYRHGPGACKVDFALDGPVPWTAPECRRAGTVHLGGTMEEIAAAETAVWRGKHPQRPFVILAQQSLFDPRRAPEGKHTVWAYCHVPPGSPVDCGPAIEHQIERFAPGFRELVLARSVHSAEDLERYNPNYVGGDITGGVNDLAQLFRRPVSWRNPYATPVEGLYLCSSATPPGGGVHGMCGYHAARAALLRELRA